MKVWQDLFGCVLLGRPWGRIGTEGRVSLDPHHGQPGMHAIGDETLARSGMFRAAAVPAAGAFWEP
jgi:hypothetical protein